jgi:RNA polymerase sigma-70 factor (ECF subfamily)
MEHDAHKFEGNGEPEAKLAAGSNLASLFGELAMGNIAALEGIYDAMSTEIYRLALWRSGAPDVAADVVQTVFVRLAERRARLGVVRDPRSYLLAMAHRAAVDRRRAAARQAFPVTTELLQPGGTDPDRALDARRASAALEDLPPAQREAVFLHHFSGMTFAAIGRVTGVPTFTAASRVRIGIRVLRRLLGLS